MPSPFPGMDPYLEDPVRWPGVHHRLITYIADTLSASLPRRYVAEIGERLYVVQTARDIYPDVLVKEPQRRKRPAGKGGKTAATAWDTPLLVSLEEAEMREGFIEIRLTEEKDRVVTVIEVLSPSNKASGTPGHEQYLTKKDEVLRSRVHLLEIDLLRHGSHTVIAPLAKLSQLAVWDYLISLKRGHRNSCEVWPVPLRRRLPRVPVPLAERDPDLSLDLQTLLDRVYDLGGYAHRIDYRKDPIVPLERADATWADALLRSKGLRPPRRGARKRGDNP